jgi:hypothetical protein
MTTHTWHRRTNVRPHSVVVDMGRSPLSILVVLAQVFVLDLCLCRAAMDLLHGSLSREGAAALAAVAVLCISLVPEILRTVRRLVEKR